MNNTPTKARIISHSITKIEDELFDNFKINNSFNTELGKIILTPDFAICENCENELNDKNNHRYAYPFITCTNCGPRYSIINKLPYDRESTTMHNFLMCKKCYTEYNSPENNRFYSQTNSCPDCGVELSEYENNFENEGNYSQLINKIVDYLKQGKIVSVKGIGGYLLLADACNESTIINLRKRKNRPTKPFALMVNNEEKLKEIAIVSDIELKSWKSQEAEIVLLKVKDNIDNIIASNQIAPNLNKLGIMRPYAPILKLISDAFANPLIATSANLSGSPIIYDDAIAKENLSKIADYILLNNREILIPQDDSVVQFSEKGTRIVLRRSRGIAPNYFGNPINNDDEIVAVGSLLKSAFTFYKNKQFYISQYLGNTYFLESQQAYEKTFTHIKNIINTNPKTVICDLHPGYYSTQFAESLSHSSKIKLEKVQHHEAHFAAVIGENNLINEQILGFVWDGTGLGNDGEIWGGEVFKLSNNQISRIYHSKYEKHILGDKMVNEPRISALSFFNNTNEAQSLLKKKFNDNEFSFYKKAINNSTLLTSSMGRFFDAVASILQLKDKNDYEGEAAMILESTASKYKGNPEKLKNYSFDIFNSEIDFISTKNEILFDVKNKVTESEIAMKFHITLVEIISEISIKQKLRNLAFSGGAFQNSLLINLIEKKLSKENNLYFHKQLSPNDECISFGQIIRYSMKN